MSCLHSLTLCISLTDRLWCGAQHGQRRFGSLQRTFWGNTSRLILVLWSSVLTTTSCRLWMSAWRMRRTTSKSYNSIILHNMSSFNITETKISTADVPYRLIQLMEEIMAEKENKTIIFVETKKRCDDLTRRMRRDGSGIIRCDIKLWPWLQYKLCKYLMECIQSSLTVIPFYCGFVL